MESVTTSEQKPISTAVPDKKNVELKLFHAAFSLSNNIKEFDGVLVDILTGFDEAS